MPMSADDLADIKPKLEAAKKSPVGFAVCIGNTPATTVILFSKTKEPKSLVLAAKKMGETSKTTYGTVVVEEGVATLRCADEVPSDLCKRVKGLLALQKITLNVKALDPGGKAAGLEGDDGAKPAPPAPGAPQIPERSTGQPSGLASGQPPGPVAGQTAAPTTQPQAAPDPQRGEAWEKIVVAMAPRVDAYVKSAAEKAPQVAASWKGALALGKAARFDDAMLIAQKIMPLLKETSKPVAAAPQAPTPERPVQAEVPKAPPPPEAPKPAPPAAQAKAVAVKPEDLAKAARLWRETVKSMQAEMTKLEAAITAHLSPDARMADIAAKVTTLSDQIDAFDLELAVALEAATSGEPDAVNRLRDEALGHLRRYAQALNAPFFRDVDEANGFAKVAVAATARRSLGALGKMLAQ